MTGKIAAFPGTMRLREVLRILGYFGGVFQRGQSGVEVFDLDRLAACVSTLSAALTRVDAGVLGSTFSPACVESFRPETYAVRPSGDIAIPPLRPGNGTVWTTWPL